MKHLTVAQKQELEQALRTLSARLREEISNGLTANGSADTLGLSNHNQEVDDAALAELQTSLDLAAVQRDIQELRDAEAALRRLKDGNFGACSDCGAAIGFPRLHANPAAMRCIACQTQAERARGDHGHRAI